MGLERSKLKQHHSARTLSFVAGMGLAATLACGFGVNDLPEPFEGNVLMPLEWTNDDAEEADVESLPDEAQSGISKSLVYTAWDETAAESEQSTLNALILVYETREAAGLAYEALARYNLTPGAQAVSQEANDKVEQITTAVIATPGDDAQPGFEIYHVTLLSCMTVIRYDIMRYETASAVFIDLQDVAVRTAEKLYDATCPDVSTE
jgi:hypothetical protein